MAKHGDTRRKHTATRRTHKKKQKKTLTWRPNTGNVFHAANTEPTGRNWHSWQHASTVLDPDHFRRIVPRGTGRAVMAPWINSKSFIRGTMRRNYPGRSWTRSVTRVPRSAARNAAMRGQMLAGHLSAIEEGIENGLGVTAPLSEAEELEFQRLLGELDEGGVSENDLALYAELLKRRSSQ